MPVRDTAKISLFLGSGQAGPPATPPTPPTGTPGASPWPSPLLEAHNPVRTLYRSHGRGDPAKNRMIDAIIMRSGGGEPSSMSTIATRLDAARRDLLDLGLRNTLLNYRPLRSRGVEVVDESP